MDIVLFTSTVAGICMGICQVPQLIKLYRTRNVEGVSVRMQVVFTIGVLFWLITGILLDNAPMYLSNGFSLLTCMGVLFLLYKENHNKNKK